MTRKIGSVHYLTFNVVHYVVILSHCNKSREHNVISFVILYKFIIRTFLPAENDNQLQ